MENMEVNEEDHLLDLPEDSTPDLHTSTQPGDGVNQHVLVAVEMLSEGSEEADQQNSLHEVRDEGIDMQESNPQDTSQVCEMEMSPDIKLAAEPPTEKFQVRPGPVQIKYSSTQRAQEDWADQDPTGPPREDTEESQEPEAQVEVVTERDEKDDHEENPMFLISQVQGTLKHPNPSTADDIEANFIKKLDSVALQVEYYLKFETDEYNLSETAVEQIKTVSTPIVAETLQVLKAAVSVKQWAKTSLARWQEEVANLEFAEFPIKPLSKNAQKYITETVVHILELTREVLTVSMPQDQDPYMVETLREQLQILLQTYDDTEKELTERTTQLKNLQTDSEIQVTEIRKQVIENRELQEEMNKCKTEYENYHQKYHKIKRDMEQIDGKKMKEEKAALQLSLDSANELLKRQMVQKSRSREKIQKQELELDQKNSMIEELQAEVHQLRVDKEERQLNGASNVGSLNEEPRGYSAKKMKLQDTSSAASANFATGESVQVVQENHTYSEVARQDAVISRLLNRGYVSFCCKGTNMFNKHSLDKAMATLEELETYVHNLLTELQKSFPEDFRQIQEGTDEMKQKDAFNKFQFYLQFPRSQVDLLRHIANARDPHYDFESFSPALQRRNIHRFQQFPDLSPNRLMFPTLFNEETGLFQRHAILALLSLYAPRLYEEVIIWDVAGNTQERKLFKFLFGEKNSTKYYVALQLLCIFVLDQSNLIKLVEQGLQHNHILVKGSNVSKNMVPPNTGTLTENVLSEISMQRPVNYEMSELRTIFLDKTDMSMFKKLYSAERTKIKTLLKRQQEDFPPLPLQQKKPDYNKQFD